MNRIRIEGTRPSPHLLPRHLNSFAPYQRPDACVFVPGLIAAFPKLVGTDSQHTFVETENVRYIYHPLDGLYLLVLFLSLGTVRTFAPTDEAQH